MSQSIAPIDYGRGALKVSGKVKAAEINAQLFNDLFLGGTVATGQILTSFNEAQQVPAMSTYTVTATNATHFQTDLGVTYANYVPLDLVASLTAAGQYMVNASTGVYTFYLADASANVLLNYTYTASASGHTITMPNLLQGTLPTFQVVFNTSYAGQNCTVTLLRCVSSKLTISTKQGDYVIPELDFEAYDNGSGQVLTVSTLEG